MLFISDPLPSETHQTLETQGFDALARFLLILLEIYILLEISELTSLIHPKEIFLRKFLLEDKVFFFFDFLGKEKRKS
jgi:hypothetical protein